MRSSETMKRHCRARSLKRVVRFRGDGSINSGIALSLDALVREQHDQVRREFHARPSYQQLDSCIWWPHWPDVSFTKSQVCSGLKSWLSEHVLTKMDGTVKLAYNTFLALIR